MPYLLEVDFCGFIVQTALAQFTYWPTTYMSIKADIRIYYEIEYSRRGMPPFCVTSTGVIQCRDFTVTFFQFLKKATASLYTFAVIFLQPQRQ